MSSVLKKRKTKEEVTPEAFLERLEEIKRRKETFFTYISEEEIEENAPKLQKLFEELRPLIRNAIHKAKSDAKTKGEALYSFGKFAAAYDSLMAVLWLAFNLSLIYREDFYKEIIKVTERAIKMLSDIEKGESLSSVTNELDNLYFDIKEDIKKFFKSLEKYVEDLRP
jgi:tetratricopeptide (TPR) repeat protein